MAIGRRLSRAVALLRYHRPAQFGWRLCRVAQRTVRRFLPERLVFRASRRPATWKAGAQVAYRRIADRRRQLWPERSAHAAAMADGRFHFLNQVRDLQRDSSASGFAIDWNPNAPRLWRFHLQCHEQFLELADARGPESAYALVASWLDEPRHQQPTRDPDAWHPFCISRRLPVWLALAASFDPPEWLAGKFWQSVADQVSWLRANCEWDIGGNHLLENLTALCLAESFLELEGFSEPSSTFARLLAQLDEQILPSGEHYERTPTYHALMMVCVLQCVEAANYVGSAECKRLSIYASMMYQFSMWLRQPDGKFPLLGDSSHDETPDLDHLFRWAEDHWDPDESIRPRDYWSSQTECGDRILFDTGPLACDHLPAHGHADLLQITATLGGRAAIVDTGNFEYLAGEMRQRCRTTSAHNVLQLGILEQCDVWSSFRMGRRGHILWTNRGEAEHYSWCAAAHSGFGCTTGRLVASKETGWTVIDWFHGFSGDVLAKSRLHWHPDWNLVLDGTNRTLRATHVECPETPYSVCLLGDVIHPSIEDSIYCPSFGRQLTNQVLVNATETAGSGWVGFEISVKPLERNLAPSVRLRDGILTLAMLNEESLSICSSNGQRVQS